MKKAQTWIFEFIISFLIFVGLILLVFSILNSSNKSSDYNSVLKEADHISSVLMSSGVPSNWNESNLKSPGITSNNRINTSKLVKLDGVDYYTAKSLLSVSNDFVFYFENASGILNVEGTCMRGLINGCDDLLSNIEYDDLAFSRRIVILNSSIVELVVVVWR